MQARAAAVAELIKQDPSYAVAQTSEVSQPTPKPSDSATQPTPDAMDTAASSTAKAADEEQLQVMQVEQKPLQSVLAGIIDDDEMEDLFGPGTGSSTGAEASPAIALQKTASNAGSLGPVAGGADPSTGMPDLSSMLTGAVSSAGASAQTGNSLGIDLTSQFGGPSGLGGFASAVDMPTFTANSAIGGGGEAVSGQADLNTLSGDDFNALLAGLSAETNADPLQGFSLGGWTAVRERWYNKLMRMWYDRQF